ncbi:MAG: bifunctional (p)ppGpp synthetase/guanosine-3',5'-bis(diphosphate) 3'-pyrophosphohydrolase [Clostridia bacterium]|nr:bifunctional (p)ppGpp synthetase/guanosine-3',5'-bis(diphosphate) 3'-pyrophosphohydrolase [Clostridia bacterium]
MSKNLIEKIIKNFSLESEDEKCINSIFETNIDLDRVSYIVDTMIDFHMDKESLISFLIFQVEKVEHDKAEELIKEQSKEIKELYEIFKILTDVTSFSISDDAEDMRKMFIAISQDLRMIIIKLAIIEYDMKQLSLPLNDKEKVFVSLVKDIYAPLAERFGLYGVKSNLEDLCLKYQEPEVYKELENNVLLKKEENSKQIELTKEKLEDILSELEIKGEITFRQKHYSSIYKKIINKHVNLGQIYDLIAMRVIVDSIEDCYSILGKIHAIYKPIAGRVKDYIANPKPNGYQSLHTTILAENKRPLEIQIRTFDMHRIAEYGIAAHWIYKEKRLKRSKLDEKITWFREILDNSTSLSSDEFLETLKIDLYGGEIFVQTPKGKVLEFPEGSTIIDFAYAIHSDIGNTCVGGKINGKIQPITTELENGDVVEILTNPNSKGPSRDWLNHIKTTGARGKIKAFFRSELKDDNIKSGKAMLEQAIKNRNLSLTKLLKNEYLEELIKKLSMTTLNELYAEIGAGSMQANNVVGRLIVMYNKECEKETRKETIVTIKQNSDGVMIDGDSGMLIKYAGCCSPVTGDEIIGYISRGKGVTIHRKECQNLINLEPERLVKATWQESIISNFLAVIKVIADKNTNISKITLLLSEMKINLKGFNARESNDDLLIDITLQVKNKNEINKIILGLEKVKGITKVYRSE